MPANVRATVKIPGAAIFYTASSPPARKTWRMKLSPAPCGYACVAPPPPPSKKTGEGTLDQVARRSWIPGASRVAMRSA
ncbi:hypothetical protein BDY21DRAFT_330453 [Lineolata rhizophorae]|uniref:Uncharacterized protein n=1 Tax=Lineolata rhizophorae TaxID=578093 RepID=A0A6A6PE44_9PEZI|nr:hypothetical protein BDY21DRAFT_330453 [Lineolata rhizophorae]